MHSVQQDARVRSLLELDPELGAGIAQTDRGPALDACRLSIVAIPRGGWDPSAPEELIGYMIVAGLVCRELTLRDHHMFELLGTGDIVLPPPGEEWPRLGGNSQLTAIEPTLVSELGGRFAEAGARWPSLLVNVARRLEQQRERLAIQGLIAHVAQAEHRLLLQLWHLATQWGRVTPEGMTVPFHLTHDLLGQLIGARRSTVTLAARSLADEGLIRRVDDGTWLLTAAAERAVTALIGPSSLAVGEVLMTRQRSMRTKAEAAALRAEARRVRSVAPRR